MAIAAGGTYSVALKADGTATVWGDNRVTVIADPRGVIGISSGAGHVLALLADGNVVAWGGNEHGQAQVPFGLTNVIAVSAMGESIGNRNIEVAEQMLRAHNIPIVERGIITRFASIK